MIKVKNDSNDELKTWLNKWTRNIKKNIKATPKMPDVYQINTQNKKDTLERMNWSGILSLNLYLDTFLIQGVHLKLCFFPNSLQPIPCMKESNSSDLRFECTGTVFGRPFSVQPIAAQWWLGRGRKILTIFWKKTQYLINTMYLQCFCPIF